MFCEKTFFDNSSRNRHQKKFHNQEQRGQQSTSFRAHIFCSLCPKDEKESFASYALLTRHLAARHDIEVKETSIEFPNTADFENWMTSERLNTKFVLQRTARYRNIYTKYYCCNRSNSAGLCKTHVSLYFTEGFSRVQESGHETCNENRWHHKNKWSLSF